MEVDAREVYDTRLLLGRNGSPYSCWLTIAVM